MKILLNRFPWLFVLLLLLTLTVRAQQLVEFDACSGTLERCVTATDTLYEMCFNVKPSPPCPFTSFEVDWGDGQTQPYPMAAPTQIKHQFDLKSFLKNCGNGSTKQFKIFITTNCPGNNKGVILTFKIKPTAQFLADACEGRPLTLQNLTCPNTTDMTWAWDFGDGTTAITPLPSKTFSTTASSYKVKLTATNTCGTSTVEQTIPIKKIPVAKYGTSGYTINPVNVTDTVVCLSNGGVLTMDATISLDATSYSWQVSPSTYKFINGTNASSPKPQIQFIGSGTYTVTLTAYNNCGTSKPMVCTHKVVDLPSPKLTPQPDRCEPFSYLVVNPVAGATYTLNGVAFSPTQPQSLSLSTTPYIVAASLSNTCGNQTARDTFLVAPPSAVRITSPASPTVLCIGSSPLLLTADLTGGTWTGTNSADITRQGGRDFFNPRTPGRFTLTYQRGTGTCLASDTVTVEVQGVQATVQNSNICAGQATVMLDGSPTGGRWTTTDCVNCITGNVLTLTGLTATQIRAAYTVTSSGGCSASAVATVTIGRPTTSFSMTNGCSGTAIKTSNTSTGATTFQWLVNGNLVSTEREPSLLLPAGAVRVTLVGITGSCSTTASQDVTITAPPATASFTPSVASGCSPLPVSFILTGAAQPGVTYNWNFGNGKTSTDFQPTPQSFTNTGRQPQSFTVTFSGGNTCGSLPKVTQIITVLPRAKAEIGVDSTTIRCPPTAVTFTNRSTGFQGNITWDFGDGTSPVSNSLAVTKHDYLSPTTKQVYIVRLTVNSSCGSDRDSVQITVYPKDVVPVFTISKSKICPGDKVTFTDASTPVPALVKWDIDGHSLEGKAVTYDQFTKPGTTYKIKETVYPECGGFATREQTIMTDTIPKGDFIVPIVSCASQPVSITNTSDTRLRFRWNFGDGSPVDSTYFSPIHTYASSGQTYTVTMTIIGFPVACTNVVSHPIGVRKTSQPAFSIANSGVVCSDTLVSLLDQSQNATEWKWYANGRLISTTQNPQLRLTKGNYDIKLWTSNNGTCPDSISQQDVVRVDTCALYVATIFTPDGNGISDHFNIYGQNLAKIQELRIFSRWGVQVYEATNLTPNTQTEGWDGQHKGQRLPADNYVYEAIVEFVGGSTKKQRGVFTLLR